jgi:hypothetical protein
MKTDRIYKFQIRQDLIDEGLNVPIIWIEKSYPCQCFDTREVSMTTEKGETITKGFKDFGPHFLEHTETLEVEESFPEEMDEIITEDGYNTIISITDPEHDWIDRKALAYSIDFQSYDESDPLRKGKHEQDMPTILLSDWMRWWDAFDGDTWAYEFAHKLVKRTKDVLKKEGKDHSVYLLHIHDIDGAERYYELGSTATEFAEEFYSHDNGYYTAQKIELESEDEHKGFMKAFYAIHTDNSDTLDISKDEYNEIKTVEKNHA